MPISERSVLSRLLITKILVSAFSFGISLWAVNMDGAAQLGELILNFAVFVACSTFIRFGYDHYLLVNYDREGISIPLLLLMAFLSAVLSLFIAGVLNVDPLIAALCMVFITLIVICVRILQFEGSSILSFLFLTLLNGVYVIPLNYFMKSSGLGLIKSEHLILLFLFTYLLAVSIFTFSKLRLVWKLPRANFYQFSTPSINGLINQHFIPIAIGYVAVEQVVMFNLYQRLAGFISWPSAIYSHAIIANIHKLAFKDLVFTALRIGRASVLLLILILVACVVSTEFNLQAFYSSTESALTLTVMLILFSAQSSLEVFQLARNQRSDGLKSIGAILLILIFCCHQIAVSPNVLVVVICYGCLAVLPKLLDLINVRYGT